MPGSKTMKIIDLKDMPDFNSTVPNGIDSVSQERVTVVTNKYNLTFPSCHIHGAMNKVSERGIWRCLTCHEGCFEVANA